MLLFNFLLLRGDSGRWGLVVCVSGGDRVVGGVWGIVVGRVWGRPSVEGGASRPPMRRPVVRRRVAWEGGMWGRVRRVVCVGRQATMGRGSWGPCAVRHVLPIWRVGPG